MKTNYTESELTYMRLITISCLDTLGHFSEILSKYTGFAEKKTLTKVSNFAKSTISGVTRLNKNPMFKSFYEKIERYRYITNNILALVLTLNEESVEDFIRHIVRWIPYYNARYNNQVLPNPEWMYFGTPVSSIDLDSENIEQYFIGKPKDEQICLVKAGENSFPVLTVYEANKEIFVDHNTNTFYFANNIYKFLIVGDTI